MCIHLLSIHVCSFTYSFINHYSYIPHFRLKAYDNKIDIHKEVLASGANPVISD